MIASCPSCGMRASLEVFATDDDARRAVVAALGLPAKLQQPILAYLSLFRPEKNSLSWKRAGKLLEELSGLINTGTITRDGKVYAAPVEVWERGLIKVVDQREKITRPLSGHG